MAKPKVVDAPCQFCPAPCCTYYKIDVYPDDVNRILAGLGGRYQDYFQQLGRMNTIQEVNGACMFMATDKSTHKCTIHDFRPDACRNYHHPRCQKELKDYRDIITKAEAQVEQVNETLGHGELIEFLRDGKYELGVFTDKNDKIPFTDGVDHWIGKTGDEAIKYYKEQAKKGYWNNFDFKVIGVDLDKEKKQHNQTSEAQVENDEVNLNNLEKDIIEFLSKNPNPNDETFHKFAESKGYDVEAAEATAYRLAAEFAKFVNEGRAHQKGLTESDFDPEVITRGMKVESEHTKNTRLQKKITLDHLAEFENYYDYIGVPKMEEELKKAQQVTSDVDQLSNAVKELSGAMQGGRDQRAEYWEDALPRIAKKYSLDEKKLQKRFEDRYGDITEFVEARITHLVAKLEALGHVDLANVVTAGENYIGRMLVEPAADKELTALLGERIYDELARIVEQVDKRVDKRGKLSHELDSCFPLDTAEDALKYLKAYAKETNSIVLTKFLDSLNTDKAEELYQAWIKTPESKAATDAAIKRYPKYNIVPEGRDSGDLHKVVGLIMQDFMKWFAKNKNEKYKDVNIKAITTKLEEGLS